MYFSRKFNAKNLTVLKYLKILKNQNFVFLILKGLFFMVYSESINIVSFIQASKTLKK